MTNLRGIACTSCQCGMAAVLTDVLTRREAFGFYAAHAGHALVLYPVGMPLPDPAAPRFFAVDAAATAKRRRARLARAREAFARKIPAALGAQPDNGNGGR
jgi:hypothetical protein